MPPFVPCLFAVLREGNDGKMTRDVARSKTPKAFAVSVGFIESETIRLV